MRWPWRRKPEAVTPRVIVTAPSPVSTESLERIADVISDAIGDSAAREVRTHYEPAPVNATAMPSPNLTALRIVSDGLGLNTRVYLGDEQISGCVGITWTVRGGGVARALIEVDGVQITHNEPAAAAANERA